jgi:GT2 family glycosyltransferase
MNDVGVVAIGRNEGERLRGCLASLAGREHVAGLAYVDSGSTDRSVDLARSMGVEVVELDMSRPFSAARARNEGFQRLKRVAPGLRFVMFVDGDCEVVEGWIARARAELEARPDAAVVCGRRREKFPEASVFNRLADLEWDSPIGEALACGGDSVMRAEAFEAVGGFDPTCPAGEEPQLCTRLRKAGWSVWRVDAEMTRHDLAMTDPRQWWRRHYRSGYAGLDVTIRFPGEPRLFVREMRRARIWGAGLPAAALAAGAIAGVAFGPLAGLGVVGVLALAYPLQVLRLARKIRPRVADFPTALAYGYHTTIAKWANLAGQIACLRDRRRGRMARLIEYKAPEPARAGTGAATTR